MNDWAKGIFSIVLCELVGLLGTPFTIASIPTWYATLTKPPLLPPNWIFGPVWTLLYFLMGVSLFLIWTSKAKGKHTHQQKKVALIFFSAQLGLNFLWSFIFFYLHHLLLATIEIILLWGTILITILVFRKITEVAAWLLIPYLLWVSFATYLTTAIWLLN